MQMKIINDTPQAVDYLVVPSGLDLSKAVASGSITPHSTRTVEINDPDLKVPDVLVRPSSKEDDYYFRLALAGLNFTARIAFTAQ
jgi:hypothetical protein